MIRLKLQHSAMQGGFIFMYSSNMLNIVDVSDPETPRWIGSSSLPDFEGTAPFALWQNSLYTLYYGDIKEYSLTAQ